MDEAEQLCDYIIIMHQGRILREGTLNQLLDEDHGRKVITFTLENCDFTPQAVESKIPFQFQWDSVNKKGTVLLNDMDKDLSSFLSVLRQNNLQLKNMECRRRTLDDLFIELTGRSLDE